jgi:hypothetical protein
MPWNVVEVYWHLRGTCYFPVSKLLPDYMISHSRRQNSRSEPNRRKHSQSCINFWHQNYFRLGHDAMWFTRWLPAFCREYAGSIFRVDIHSAIFWKVIIPSGKSWSGQVRSGQAEWYTAILCTLLLDLTPGLGFASGHICLLICMLVQSLPHVLRMYYLCLWYDSVLFFW